MSTSRHYLLICFSFFSGCLFVASAQAEELRLALANSTCHAMNMVEDLYRVKHPIRFTHFCKSSGLLAKGMRGGVLTADIFISADREWMDFAVENDLVAAERVSSPWGNTLVIATPKNSLLKRIELEDLASDKVAVILIGDPARVKVVVACLMPPADQ